MAKLTLSVDERVVERAKRYAAKRRTSVSSLVEHYLRMLASTAGDGHGEAPRVLSRLRGALRGGSKGQSADRDYRRYLERKYR